MWATDAAFSPDGQQLAVRGYFGGVSYAWNGGKLKRQGQLDVPLQGQGESVTYSRDGSKIMYGSEGAESGVDAEDAPSEGGSDSPSGSGSSASGTENGGDSDGNVRNGAIAVAVLFAAYLGLKGLRRRRPSS